MEREKRILSERQFLISEKTSGERREARVLCRWEQLCISNGNRSSSQRRPPCLVEIQIQIQIPSFQTTSSSPEDLSPLLPLLFGNSALPFPRHLNREEPCHVLLSLRLLFLRKITSSFNSFSRQSHAGKMDAQVSFSFPLNAR